MKPAWGPCFALLAAAAALTACDHSDPFPTGPRPGDGSFNTVQPIQLTFSTGEDDWPSFSSDGRWISYRFARGSTDRDYCAGILPASGGQRYEEICAWEIDQASRTDDFRALVLLGDDMMAFTRHRSSTGNQAPQEGGLYLAPRGRERDGIQVLPLLATPSGGSDTWTYLIDPVAIGDRELLVLAAKAFIGQRVPFGPVDTVYRGVEFARLDLSTNPAGVTVIAPAPDAVSWQLDEVSGRVYYHRRYYSGPLGGGQAVVVADSIFRFPLAGGAAEVVWGRPTETTAPGELSLGQGMGGFGVGGGRLFVTIWDRRQPAPAGGQVPPPETRTRILEVVAGEPALLRQEFSTAHSIWTRLSVSRNGRYLVAARVTGGTLNADKIQSGARDLFLFPLGS